MAVTKNVNPFEDNHTFIGHAHVFVSDPWVRAMRMTTNTDEPRSPTATKVLDEYLVALLSDDDLDNEMVGRLDLLLRKSNVPKPDDIDTALFPLAEADSS